MKPKMIVKLCTDFAMTVILLLSMPYEMIGQTAHEWLGIAIFALFILHHILNGGFYKSIFKGKFTPIRIFQIVLFVGVTAAMLGSAISGVIISRHALNFLPISGGRSFGRTLHMLSAYWGFILMSLHLGFHWGVMLAPIKKLIGKPPVKWTLRAIGTAIAGYGAYAFIKREMAQYLFLKTQFVFFDFEESLMFLIIDYLSIMGLFVYVGHYISLILKRVGKKKKMKAKLAFLTIVILFFSACSSDKTPIEYSKEFFAMDTYISLTAYGENAEQALETAQQRFCELEKLWSVTDENSEIYAINHSAGAPVTVSADTVGLISYSLEIARETHTFEPTIYPVLTAWGFTTDENRVPTDEEIQTLLQNVGSEKVTVEGNTVRLENGVQLDTGAVGKGAAGDEIVGILKENGIKSALLDIGGNIQLIGDKNGADRRLGIRNPFGEGTAGVLEISDSAAVTSGNYEKFFTDENGVVYGHIIDPSTGYPADSGLASATIVADEGKRADAFSTAVFIMGLEKAAEFWRENRDFEMILISQDGEIYLTEGLRERFTPNSAYDKGVHVIGYEED